MASSLLQRAVQNVGPERLLEALTPQSLQDLQSCWPAWARPEQLEPPGKWRVWLILAGRGFGKSRTGAETVRDWARRYPGCHIALVGRTAADVRDVMVRALLTPWRGGVLRPEDIPLPVPSARTLIWRNGSRATTYSAEEPRQLRGPQHDFVWADELAAWPSGMTKARLRSDLGTHSVMEETWNEGIMMGLRGSGECKVSIDRTRCIVTTTPRPKRLLREILADRNTVTTRGNTYENAANLPAEYVAQLHQRYDGTRIGRQEIEAEILDDIAGALWTHASIDDYRVVHAPELVRVVVAIDPSGRSDVGDEQGIIVAGKGVDGDCYVLADRTTHDTPEGWGRRAVQAYIDFRADRIVAEKNYGGDMVGFVVEMAARNMETTIAYRDVTATRGKLVRAEPVSALYEQGRVHHVGTDLELLEDQMRTYIPESGRSPDRMDALVWAITDLMLGEPTAGFGKTEFQAPGFQFSIPNGTDDDDD